MAKLDRDSEKITLTVHDVLKLMKGLSLSAWVSEEGFERIDLVPLAKIDIENQDFMAWVQRQSEVFYEADSLIKKFYEWTENLDHESNAQAKVTLTNMREEITEYLNGIGALSDDEAYPLDGYGTS